MSHVRVVGRHYAACGGVKCLKAVSKSTSRRIMPDRNSLIYLKRCVKAHSRKDAENNLCDRIIDCTT